MNELQTGVRQETNELQIMIKQETKDFISLFKNRSKNKKSVRLLFKNTQNYNLIKDNLKEVYDNGFGFKLIARELNISYSEVRSVIIKVFNIPVRKGYNVITQRMKEFRSKKAKLEGFGKDWPIKYI